MESLGIPREEIKLFANPMHWLDYFPPHAIDDINALGCKIDWRRSFITTDANPFFDSFARWQFTKMKQLEKIKFGERYTVFSPLDGQPCMDHDRQSGEGLGPQEYLGIKLEVVQFTPESQQILDATPELKGKKLSLVAATLRPETMYGQTNCFVSNKLDYIAVQSANPDEVYIISHRSARNMSFQSLTHAKGEVKEYVKFPGSALIGTRVKAPFSQHPEVYVLPMDTILATKGTGVVTSVPSDSPDDYANVMDLCKKPEFYKIQPEWIQPFEVAPVVSTPTYGDAIAPKLCQEMKINSPKDKDQLALAKEVAYKEGFYNGTMLQGEFKGMPVQEAKPLVRDSLIAHNLAFKYSEPEGVIMSRSGDECVVALCDQWYMDYGEEKWLALAKKCLERMNLYGEEPRRSFERTLDWLHQWACARSFGLGSRVPFDENFLIESLSDSTVYMAYYTVSHYLQGNSLNGSNPNEHGIAADMLTDDVWDFIFLEGPSPANTKISQALLQEMKDSFNYFYPMDLRVSGKDLIPNHLTFSIYNHTAMFDESKWPKGFRTNGHLLLNGEKMSKSTGNFLTLAQSIELYGSDATRITLADAGDSIEDANFEETTANAAILRLYTLLEWAQEVLSDSTLRSGPKDNFWDNVFESEMNHLVQLADQAFDNMLYRDALKYGLYEFQAARDAYRDATSYSGGMHIDLIKQYLTNQCLLIAPFAPHFADHIWMTLLNNQTSIMQASWPELSPLGVDQSALEAGEYLRKLVKTIRDLEIASGKKKSKGKGPQVTFDASKPKNLDLQVATEFPQWQAEPIEVLKGCYDAATKTFDDKQLKADMGAKGLLKDKKVMPFAQEIKKRVILNGEKMFNRSLQFDEQAVLNGNVDYIAKSLGYNEVKIVVVDVETVQGVQPGEPKPIMTNIE
jgi:leucyl-tRNA synthetase